MLQPFDFDPAEKTKHKFMIQSIVMVGESTEADVVSSSKEWWPIGWDPDWIIESVGIPTVQLLLDHQTGQL